jgi:hypothetical protein
VFVLGRVNVFLFHDLLIEMGDNEIVIGRVFMRSEMIRTGVCRAEQIYSYNNLDIELRNSS